MQDDFLTLNEVAKYLKIPKSTIYKLSQKGQLPSSKVGKQLRFRKASLDKWLSDKEGGSAFKREGYAGKKKCILLIDDDRLVLKSISRFLNMHGYTLIVAQNGREALEKIKKECCDLIITDIRMPEMDGIETIKKIRELSRRDKRPRAREIIITGFADTAAQQAAEELGIKDYIYKPFSTADFLETIERNLAPGLEK